MTVLVRRLIPSVTLVFLLCAPVAHASTITMSATYYTIAESDQDMNRLAGGTFNNEVQGTLGPDGLPILNTTSYGCTSNCFDGSTPLPADLTASGEITWWSPSLNNGGAGAASDVTETNTGTIALPYSNLAFYPPNGSGTGDEAGFQAAVFDTTLSVPSAESISFNVGADDVAFVYLDNNLVCDLGGVHGDSPGACTSSDLTPGDHSLELFFADLHTTGAALTFDVTTAGITGNPTPEPATMTLVAAAIVVLGALRRRI